MQLFGQPAVILKTSKKLHVSKNPGLFSWAAVLAAGYVGELLASIYISEKDVLWHSLVAIGSATFALWCMETWQDLVIDREEGIITVLDRNWYHWLFVKVPARNINRFPLSWVTCVLVSDKRGIDIVRKDGSTVIIAPHSTNIRKLQLVRKEISTFLRLEMLEELPANYYYQSVNLEDFWDTQTSTDDLVPALVESDMETLDTDFGNLSKT